VSDQVSSVIQAQQRKLSTLSQCQLDCLRLVHMGLATKEIAAELNFSPHEVDDRVRRAIKTLDVATRTEAANLVFHVDSGASIANASELSAVEHAVEMYRHLVLKSVEIATAPSAPPRWAVEVISFVVPNDKVEAILGDLEEGFASRAGMLGPGHAIRWYKLQVIYACVAFTWRWVRRLGGIEAILHRICSGL